MLKQNTLIVQPGTDSSVGYKLDFQQGEAIFSVIPITDDEEAQVAATFKAQIGWSNNGKFYVYEPLCDLVEAGSPSSGESLVTTVQSAYARLAINNPGTTPQKFYVSLNIPTTSSLGVI